MLSPPAPAALADLFCQQVEDLRRCKQSEESSGGRKPGGALWQEPRLGANRANIAACEGLCRALAEGAASGSTKEAAGRVRSVWVEAGEVVLQGYLQRKNSLGSGTTAAVLRGKSGGLGQPKKVQDKGRWSQSAHLPVTTARNAGRVKGLRDFPSPPAQVVGFEDFQIQGGR